MSGISENGIPLKVRNICVTVYQTQYDGPGLLAYVRETFKCRAAIFSKERCPTTQREHYQGYIELKGQIRNSTIHKKLFNCHMEVRRGSARQAWDYCTKPETHIEGPWSFGEPTLDGQRTDLSDAMASIEKDGYADFISKNENLMTAVRYGKGLREIIYLRQRFAKRDKPEVILLYGEPGTGKSRYVWDTEDRPVRIPANLRWFSNYIDEEAILIEEVTGTSSDTQLNQLLDIMDRYPLSVEVKNGHVNAKWKRIYITSNVHPRRWYDWAGRRAQWPALTRRFTQVHVYENQEVKILNEEEMKEFFNY